MLKKILFFLFAVSLSFLAATDRWGDSAHSTGFITADGGKVRSARPLESGYSRYSIVATARVRAPYKGDARVVLEGTPALDHDIFLSGLSLDLGFRDGPRFRDGTIHGLKPGDKVNLWVVVREPSSGGGISGQYILALYDAGTGRPVYSVPLIFKNPGAQENEEDCH